MLALCGEYCYRMWITRGEERLFNVLCSEEVVAYDWLLISMGVSGLYMYSPI